MNYSINQRRLAFVGIILCGVLVVVSAVILKVYRNEDYDSMTELFICIHYINNIVIANLMLPVLFDIVNDNYRVEDSFLLNLMVLFRFLSFIVFISSTIMSSTYILGDGRVYPKAVLILIEGCIVFGIPTIILSISVVVLILECLYYCMSEYIKFEKLRELLPGRSIETVRLDNVVSV